MAPHEDRLSNLPDTVLHQILSLLDSQEAVRTCVLSKRWVNLWTFIHSLDLSLPDFKKINTQSPNFERSFMRFVDTLLSRREPLLHLHAFRLFCEEDNFTVNHQKINAWILYAVRHNAKVIEVSACLFRKLPKDIFTCASLQELNLDISGLGKGLRKGVIPGGVNLPRLKKLHLCGIMSWNRCILRRLLSGCPALEDLHLNVCSIDMCFISSPQLKYLTIFSGLDKTRIKAIRAPNLISLCLELRGDVLCAAIFDEMPFLVDASITVHDGTGFDGNCNILSALPNVKNLKLRGSVMKDLLSMELPKCPTFFNLTDLHISEQCMCFSSNLVSGMLKYSANLENLQIYRNKRSLCYQCRGDALINHA
ncbi:FBD-associated F-box protein At4g10400-like [Carex rostrata]